MTSIRTRIESRRTTEFLLLVAASIPVLLIYALFILNTGTPLSVATLGVPIGLMLAFLIAHLAIRFLAPDADPAILPIVYVLSGIGITFVVRLNPDNATGQIFWLFVGVVAMIATLAVVKNLETLARYKYSLGAVGVVLLVLPMFIGSERGGSKLWLSFGGLTFQPGEISKILIVLFLASYLAENREALSASSRKVGPFMIPRFRMVMPLLIMWALSLVVVVGESDLGSALLFFTIFILMLYVTTGRRGYVILGFLLLGLGALISYQFFRHVRVRFDIWLNPFSDPSGRGLQIVQSLYSLADGGLIGSGIGRGLPTLIPVVSSDFIFSAIGEEMGLLGGSAILLLFMLLAIRGLATAARAKSDMAAFTAVGLTAALSFQAFLIVAGVTRLLPLTGVTLPFMSQGGSSLLASFIVVGLLLRAGDEGTGRDVELAGTGINKQNASAHVSQVAHGSHVRARFNLDTPESGVLGRVALSKRLVTIVGGFTLLFAALIANLTYIQVIKASEYQNMPNNNHTIAKSSKVQRGSISTSDGVLLAQSVKNEQGNYTREYPQGSLAQHMVGYISPRYGSAGIEASQNDVLTGHADHSTWQSTLYSLAGVEQPGNSVTLTINAKMQRIVEKALKGRAGAIVVLDPKTGAVLASASAPTYNQNDIASALQASGGPLLNRATQALYAPGSTFKTVTLAAALDSHIAQLNDRVNAPGEIEIDNASVTNAHKKSYGNITLQKAFALSCNTVYGPLAVELGSDKLVSYAHAFGFDQKLGQDFDVKTSVMPDPKEMTEWETAWAGSGQPVGQHKSPAGPQATVMQNAVIAQTIANNGVTMNPYVVKSVSSAEGVIVSTTQPRSLGQAISTQANNQVKEAMKAVVNDGIGGAAAVKGVQVAGKTGTSEVNDTTQNSLFIGFAPYDEPQLAISICLQGTEDEAMRDKAAQVAGDILPELLRISSQKNS